MDNYERYYSTKEKAAQTISQECYAGCNGECYANQDDFEKGIRRTQCETEQDAYKIVFEWMCEGADE